MTRTKTILLAATGLSLFASAMPATAQNAGNDEAEIIVTARKRQESILKVPVIETVLAKAQLERNQVTDLYDVASMVPGVVLGQGSHIIGTQISIRGVGTSAIDPGVDQSVTLNVDGLQISQGTAYQVGVFDMAQIEVLKGPQALFYGKNSPGGVVSIRTADPGDALEVVGRAGYEFVADEWRGEAIISGPVSETFGLRLAARYANSGGFFRNVGAGVPATGSIDPPHHYGKSNTIYLRGTALFRPSSAFTARLKLNYTRDRMAGQGSTYQLVSCPDGFAPFASRPGFPLLQFFAPQEDCKLDRKLSITYMNPAAFPEMVNNATPFMKIEQKFGSLELNYNIRPDLTLTSVTGYFKVHTISGSVSGNSGFSAPNLGTDQELHRRDFTQEIRLNSSFEGPLNFTAGGYYQDAKLSVDTTLWGNRFYSQPLRVISGSHDVDIKSLSFFAQARYRPVAELEISGGARWTHEKRSDHAVTLDVFGAYGPAGGTVFPNLPRLNTKNWSPELTLTYTPTDDLTLFGSLKQGYKSGSYTVVVPTNPGQNTSFGDEKVQGGEIGLKTRLAERQLFVNLAGYYYKYKGLQVGANEATSTSVVPIFRTINAASAKTYGVDFDMNYKPTSVPGLDLRASANWNVGRFIKFDNAPCTGGETIADGCNRLFNPTTQRFTSQSLSGRDLNRAPRWQMIFGATYETPLGGDMKLTVGSDVQYSSKYWANLGNRKDFIQGSFAKLNANIALEGPNEAWEVALIGNNLTNKLTTGTCSSLNYAGANISGVINGTNTRGPSGVDEVICSIDRGRELWIRLTLRPAAL